MTTAVPANTRNGTLDDGHAGAEIRRIACALARHVPRRAYVTIGGMVYFVRAELQRLAPEPPVVLVAVERCPANVRSTHEIARRFRLTPQETRVAVLLADRRSNREIAHELGVTQHTARRHTERALCKLGIHRRTDVRWIFEGRRAGPVRSLPDGVGHGEARR